MPSQGALFPCCTEQSGGSRPIHPIALGDAGGTATLAVPLAVSVGFGLSFIGDPAATFRPTMTETVPVRRLDDVVEECAISRVDFIKVDIAELRSALSARYAGLGRHSYGSRGGP